MSVGNVELGLIKVEFNELMNESQGFPSIAEIPCVCVKKKGVICTCHYYLKGKKRCVVTSNEINFPQIIVAECITSLVNKSCRRKDGKSGQKGSEPAGNTCNTKIEVRG